MNPTERVNIHASGCVIGTCGLLVLGPSGSGKTQLTQALITRAQQQGLFARWLSDDRVDGWLHHDRLLAGPPAPLEGLREQRFLGIVPVENVERASIDLIVELKPAEQMERVSEAASLAIFEGAPLLPAIGVPQDNLALQVDIVFGFIESRFLDRN